MVDAFEGLDHTAIAEPAFDNQDLRLDDEITALTPDVEPEFRRSGAHEGAQ